MEKTPTLLWKENFGSTKVKINMLIRTGDFSVSQAEIDEQHREIITIFDKIISNIRANEYTYDIMISNIVNMDDLIMNHMLYEEELMVNFSYPEIETHKKQHNQFRDKLEAFNLYDITRPKEYYEESMIFLLDWFSIHAMQADKKLGSFIQHMTK